MNPSGYYGRSGSYGRTSRLRGRRDLPGYPERPASGAPDERYSVTQKVSRGYGQRPLSQRAPRHYPAGAHTQEQARGHERTGASAPAQNALGEAFSYLRTHPQRALDSAEVLLHSQGAQPFPSLQIMQLKARALFLLNRSDDCIAFIDSLEARTRNDKNLLMTKARALQAKGCFTQALLLFQHLYIHHSASYKDLKTHSLGLGRLLQHMGGADNLEKALAIFTRLRTRAAAGRANTPCNDKEIELALGRHLQIMGGTDNRAKALAVFTLLRTRAAGGRTNSPCDDKEIELALGRHLQIMGGTGNLEKALAVFSRLRTRAAGGRPNSPCNDKEIELALGRHLQIMGGTTNLEKALAIFTRLRTQSAGGRTNTPCNDKDIELTFAKQLQLMGGADNLEQALAIYTKLRTWHAGGRVNTPCDDEDIELTLGRHLEIMGGPENMEKALAIYTRLRTCRTGGRIDTPCNDKEIELALGRHLQLMGGAANLDQALAIFTRLRARAAGGQDNTPCDDKDIELSLGSFFVMMGGPDNLEKARAIFTRLRMRAAGGKANTPCDDKEIELALATLFSAGENWPEFDALQLEIRHLPGFEPHLCLSIRYFSELLKTPGISPGQSRLLGQATGSAVLAMEESEFMNASCISQLAHCMRLLSCWPDALLNERGIQPGHVRRLSAAAKFLFDAAEMIDPCRQQMAKDQRWRAGERALLGLLSRQQTARGQQYQLIH